MAFDIMEQDNDERNAITESAGMSCGLLSASPQIIRAVKGSSRVISGQLTVAIDINLSTGISCACFILARPAVESLSSSASRNPFEQY